MALFVWRWYKGIHDVPCFLERVYIPITAPCIAQHPRSPHPRGP